MEHDEPDEVDDARVQDPVPADRAVVDRLVDGALAVLLVGPLEQELTVPVTALPDGAGEGDWLRLDLAALVVDIDQDLTRRRRDRLAQRLAHVRDERSGMRAWRDATGRSTEG